MKDRQVGPFVARVRSLIQTIRNLQMPTIAAIDGYVIGTGFELAFACDLRIATSHSQLQYNDLEMYLNSGVGTMATLIQTMGAANAKNVIFGSGNYTADGALQNKMVNECVQIPKQTVSGEILMERVDEIAMNIASRQTIQNNALLK